MADMDISRGISPQETNFLELLLQKVSVILWSSHSQNDSGDLRGVAGGDGELGCLCGKAGTSHLCDGSAHSSGCVVNGYGCRLSYYYYVCTIHELDTVIAKLKNQSTFDISIFF